jgi:hypothetical protein
MKAYKVEILIIDFDGIGAESIKTNIENVNYPNDCISPNVMYIEEAEIDWTDEHPLNNRGTAKEAYKELFY